MFFKRKGHLNFQPQIFSTFFKKDLPGHFDFVFLCPPKTVNLYPPWPRRFCSDTPVARAKKPAELLNTQAAAAVVEWADPQPDARWMRQRWTLP